MSAEGADLLGAQAAEHPARPAIIMGSSGEVVTFGELARRSNRLARFFSSLGLERSLDQSEGPVAVIAGNLDVLEWL